jgi:hypothetical protein
MSLEERCVENWKAHGFTEPEKLKAAVTEVFQKHCHQRDVIVALYQLVIPDWYRIERLSGHPQVGHELWLFVCRLFQEFDRKHHPNCLPAGAWLNWGFSGCSDLPPWGISFRFCSERKNQF